MIALCREFQCPVHIVHLSAADALPDLGAACAEGLPLTVETCAHYLTFDAEALPDGDTRAWVSGEQAAAASDEVLDALAAGNAAYEARFGYIFIVCATGRTAGEMLALLRARPPDLPDEELMVAAEEQKKITRRRLGKLLAG